MKRNNQKNFKIKGLLRKIKNLIHRFFGSRFVYLGAQKLRNPFSRLVNRFRDPSKIGIPDENNYLTPEIYTIDNWEYVYDLNRAVENKNVKNIAVLGGYGTGKSSVLKQFSDGRKNVRYVSLLHLSGECKTVNMQKEIFSQLFYKLDPNALKSSEFGRVGRKIIFRDVIRDILIVVAFLLPLNIYYVEEKIV